MAKLPDYPIIGVGASAGGLEALERFFGGLPNKLRAAIIVVQHLSPDHKSLMADLLAKHTHMRVREAADEMELEPGTVAVVLPKANLEVEGTRLRLRERAAPHAPNLPINQLFRSLASELGERVAGIVLSGTGSDGRLGIEAVKQAGGLVLVQDPSTARFDGMPLAAISTGLADAVLAPENMGQALADFAEHGSTLGVAFDASSDEDALEAIQRILLGASGIDFGEYKPATVKRRLARRMQALGLDRLDQYAARLRVDAAEAHTLASELLINVTHFFRDPEVFEALEKLVIPAVVERAKRDQIRVWVPGCSTGQEAYSIAMLLAEANPPGGFKIFATDIDAEALDVAAGGQFDEVHMAGLSLDRRDRFWTQNGERWDVERELRRRIVFAPHNIARDPPFTRLDLISCRNLLIYLTAPLQRRVLASFAFALKAEGTLLLGSSESLGDASDRFRTLDTHLKLFERVAGPRMTLPELVPTAAAGHARAAPSESRTALDAALQLLIDRVAPIAVMVDETLALEQVFGNAERLLTLPTGTASLDIVSLLPEGLQTVASLAIRRAFATNEETVMAVTEGVERGVDLVRAIPFKVGRAGQRRVVMTLEHNAPNRVVSEAATTDISDEARRQIADLQRELAFVRESLQATIEELETSNEELQATNEELLAANEELQSTNEELQSVNEELNTVNAEHQSKIGELSQTNADLDNLFDASPVGTLFLDGELRIRRFTPAITAQFSLLERDTGRPVEHITHRFEDIDLTAELRTVLQTAQIDVRELRTKAGQRYLVRLAPYLSESRQVQGVVATFVDVTELRSEQASRRDLQNVIDSLPEHVAVLAPDGNIRFVNQAWREFGRSGGASAELDNRVGPGANYLAACANAPEVERDLRALLAGERDELSFEYPCHAPGKERWFVMHAGRMADGTGAVVSHFEVTVRKLLESGAGA
jgi:two-component system CheB/CheR fusion protein